VFNHEPAGYECPFCRLVDGDEGPINVQADVVARTDLALALISPTWWARNQGHALVIPAAHHENLYDLPAVSGHGVHDLVRRVAIAVRQSYACDGVSLRQHNEPAGNQYVWHYHVHVFPRYTGDNLYATRSEPGFVSPDLRRPYAERLRSALADPALAPTN
jgi:histidine triad (HIT) family protein